MTKDDFIHIIINLSLSIIIIYFFTLSYFTIVLIIIFKDIKLKMK
jgi:hypothetical protein